MRKMIPEHSAADVVFLREVPVRLDGELLVILAGSASSQRRHAKRIVAARQDILELQGYRIKAGSRDLVTGERCLHHNLLPGISTPARARKKASCVWIEHLPGVEVQICRPARSASVAGRALQVRTEVAVQHRVAGDGGGTPIHHITLDRALIIPENE